MGCQLFVVYLHITLKQTPIMNISLSPSEIQVIKNALVDYKEALVGQGTQYSVISALLITIAEKDVLEHFTIANRTHMRYQILIGRNVLRRGFLIDPNKKLHREEDL